MALTTMFVECGPLGEVELTISYRHQKARPATQIDPEEPESATIGYIKIGGINGVEVELADDYITSEVIPHCVADWNDSFMLEIEQKAEQIREERRAA